MRALITVVALAVALPAWGQASPTPGSPEAKTKAREWFHSGGQHYDLGEFQEALHDFKEAYRNYEEPTFLFNIGQCHRQLGQKEQAVRFFRVYLSKVPNAPNRVEVKEMIGKLETALSQERALVSGRPQGTLAPPESGESKPPPSEKPEKPETPPEAAVAAAPSPAPQPALTASTTVEKPAPSPADKPVYKKWWLWTAVAAVVVVGVGIGLGVGLSSSGHAPSASTDFGTYKPF